MGYYCKSTYPDCLYRGVRETPKSTVKCTVAQAKHEHSVNSDALPNPIEARNPAPKARTTGLHAHIAFYYLSEIRGSRILYYRRQE